MEIRQLLTYFKNVKRLKGESYQVRCPCHYDKKSSLTITADGDKILMHCHAGCKTQDILYSVGLKMSDICNKPCTHKKTWQERMGAEAVYDYGSYVKIRCRGKVIRYGRIEGGEFIAGMPEGTEKTIYNLEAFRREIEKGYPVYYAEGEKDVDNLAKIGLTACTAGGCGDWRSEFKKYFIGARLIILPDNDEPGQALAEDIEKDLKEVAYSIKRVTVSDIDKGDVSDYLSGGGTRESLLALISGTDTDTDADDTLYAPWVKLKNNKPAGILTDCLAHSISNTLDYIIVNKPGLDIAEFHIFEDGVYRKCSKNEAKGYIKRYIPLGLATDNILNNVYNLLLCSPERNYPFEAINRNERVINVKNGILDLSKRRLEKHSPELISTLKLNCNYAPKAGCPLWIKYMTELCSDSDGNADKEKINLLQEWAGLLLSNVDVSRTKKCLVLTSPLGNTGKSVFLNVLEYILGMDNTTNIPIQNMSDRFALGDICGKRLNAVGDQRSDDILDSSVFKQLTGGDSVKVELKGKQSFSYKFTGGMVMACNDLPSFTDDKGGHIFERLTIIPCENVIPPEKRDGSLSHKLYREADGIFNWALEGLYRLRDNGFKFSSCRADKEKIEEYRSRLDPLFAYITENYIMTGEGTDRVKKTDFEDGYEIWCRENGINALSKKNIKERAAKSGIVLVKIHGYYFYKGIKPIAFNEISEDIPIPEEFDQTKYH